jgi:putative flippase GtrA
MCVSLLFRRRAKWSTWGEFAAYGALVSVVGGADMLSTVALIARGVVPGLAKIVASAIALVFNFVGRRYLVFPERRPAAWAPAGVPTITTRPAPAAPAAVRRGFVVRHKAR